MHAFAQVLAMPTPDEVAASKDKTLTPYSEKVDVWAVGVLVYEMLVGRPPFEVEDPKETAQLIMHAPVAGFPAHMTPLCLDFIRCTLDKSPASRPSAPQS